MNLLEETQAHLASMAKPKKAKAIDYKELAFAFNADHPYVYRDGADYIYTSTHYSHEQELIHAVRQWLMIKKHPYYNKCVSEIVGCLRAIYRYGQKDHPAVPFNLDSSPAGNVIIFKNGIYDIDLRQLTKHSNNLFCPYALPYDYNPLATCPTWLESLQMPFEGDAERIALLQEWFGYCLSGDTTRQVFMCCYGVPQGMKSVIASLLQSVIGHENATGFDLRSLTNRFGTSCLINKKLALVDEVELGGCKDRMAIVERFKSIIGEGTTDIEFKMSNIHTSVKLPTRFHISANSIPDLKDGSGALLRRALLLPIYKAVPDALKDINLKHKLHKELSGICNWGLEGYYRLQANNTFTKSEESKKQEAKFIGQSSPCLAFIVACCEVDAEHHPNNIPVAIGADEASVSKDKLIERAEVFFNDNDKYEFNPTWFMRDLYNVLPKCKQKVVERNGIRSKYIAGLRLKT